METNNGYGFIHVRNLEFLASVGVYQHERQVLQPVIVDLSVWVNVAKAALAEDISQALNYVELTSTVHKIVTSRHFNLLETLTETLACTILDTFDVEHVKLEVSKPQALAVGRVSIAIERDRKQLE